MILFISTAFLFAFCNKNDDPVTTDDPSDLTVEIVSLDNQLNKVVIQANAKNTVQYHFFIGDSEFAEETNTTGLFEYTFDEKGMYSITVRAYGPSGRYIKKETTVTLEDPTVEEVPLSRGYFTPGSYDGHELVWQDEFNGSSLNTDYWVYEIGDGCPNCGWGNNELEYYRAENSWVADSVLTIEARKEAFGGKQYTSSRIKTQGKFSFKYGRVDIRALLPKGQGMWPALWMLGNDITSVGWPQCGEIDIMEMIGGSNREYTVYGTAHWDNGDGHASYGQSKTLPSGGYDFSESYHVFSLIWDEYSIKWYVDDQKYNELSTTDAVMSEFHNPQFFIFNVAVGGNWPGSPNESTIFPQQMKVDYIRVFQPE